MVLRFGISRSVLEGIRRESAAAAPREACGLLFGEGMEVTDWQAVENIAEDPDRRFELDPAALFAALRAERTGGAKLIGYWHSHPNGDASPSACDAEMADPDGKLWLIVGREILAWRAAGASDGTCFVPVTFETVG